MKQLRAAFILILLALALPGCEEFDEILAPITATRLEIVGPSYAYGEFSEIRALREMPAYVCSYRVNVRASGTTETGGSVRFSGATLSTYDAEGGVATVETIDAGEAARIFGYEIQAGSEFTSRSIDVAGVSPAFRWQLDVAYYDVATGYTAKAEYKSRCRVE